MCCAQKGCGLFTSFPYFTTKLPYALFLVRSSSYYTAIAIFPHGLLECRQYEGAIWGDSVEATWQKPFSSTQKRYFEDNLHLIVH